jgi:hypothetical protein
MNPKEYQASVLSVESRPTKLHIGPHELEAVLETAVACSELIDRLKKVIFYGRRPEFEKLTVDAVNLYEKTRRTVVMLHEAKVLDRWTDDTGPSFFQKDLVNMRHLHAAFGIFGESGELLAALLKQGRGEKFDEVNWIEELGDAGWYPQISLDELGLSEACIRTCNVAKLCLIRYAKGFTNAAALNRDLMSEREAMEYVINRFREDPNVDGNKVLQDLCNELDKALPDTAPITLS